MRERLVFVKRNCFDRWIVVAVDNPSMGWSGSRWVPINEFGLPAGLAQVSNLETAHAARQYAAQCGLEVLIDGDSTQD